MVTDLTGMALSNASLLDEATAAAEAMTMCFSLKNAKKSKFFVDEVCYSFIASFHLLMSIFTYLEMSPTEHRSGADAWRSPRYQSCYWVCNYSS
jgi:glycine cleavage system pyridoxal-binding protein P